MSVSHLSDGDFTSHAPPQRDARDRNSSWLVMKDNQKPETQQIASATELTQHNLVFQARVMGQARDAILQGRFPDYLRSFFAQYFEGLGYPEWCVNALRSVGVDLLEGLDVQVVPGAGAKWEYSKKE